MSHMETLDTNRTHPVMATDGSLGFHPVECGRMEERWYAVQYVPGAERLVRPAIHRLGFATMLPLIRVTIPDRRVGQRQMLVAAFPGFVFTSWHPSSCWQRLFSQPGVAGIVRPVGDPHGHPARIPDAYMQHLERRMTAGVLDDVIVPEPSRHSPIDPDTEVRLTDGPFAGHVGLCQRSSTERVVILLTIMGCERSVTAQRRAVEAV